MLQQFEHIFLSSHDNDPKYLFLLFLMCVFVFLSILFLIVVIYSRISREIRNYEDKIYSKEFEDIFTSVMFEDELSEDIVQKTAEYFKDPFCKKIMLRELFNLHRKFTGEQADKLQHYYITCKFVDISLNKLKNRNWNIKAEGVVELTEMNIKYAHREIGALLKLKKRPKLINVIQQSIIRLDSERGLEMLIDSNHFISDWQQLKILELISHNETKITHQLDIWFAKNNTSINIFACRYIAQFHILEAIPLLVEQINKSTNEKVILTAIHALYTLDAPETLELLVKIYDRSTETIKDKITETLIQKALPNTLPFLLAILGENNYKRSIYACKAIKNLPDGNKVLDMIFDEVDNTKQQIIKHALDERIST